MRSFPSFPLILFIGLFMPNTGFTESNLSAQSLEGLNGVSLTLQCEEKNFKTLNLNVDEFGTIILSKLRMAGIAVLSIEDCNMYAEKPTLLLYLNIVRGGRERDVFGYDLELALKQQVQLYNGVKMQTTTWEYGFIGILMQKRGKAIYGALRLLTDQFINDWVLANPK